MTGSNFTLPGLSKSHFFYFHFPPFSRLLLPCFSFSVRLLELCTATKLFCKSAPFPYYCNCPTELHLYVYTYLFIGFLGILWAYLHSYIQTFTMTLRNMYFTPHFCSPLTLFFRYPPLFPLASNCFSNLHPFYLLYHFHMPRPQSSPCCWSCFHPPCS